MGWLDGFTYRMPIAIDNTTPAATNDVTVPIPADWDHFWDEIDSSGFEIRVTEADGFTPVTAYQWATFTKASQSGTLELDDVTCDGTAGGVCLAWLYYGNTGLGDGSASFTASGPVNGYIQDTLPGAFVVQARPVTAGQSQPLTRLQKTVGERIIIWFEMRSMLEFRQTASGEQRVWEEIQQVVADITTGGASQASMIEAAETRFVEIFEGPRKGFYVGMVAKAGSNDTNYTVEPVVTTVAPEIDIAGGVLVFGEYRTLEPRAYLAVVDIDEA